MAHDDNADTAEAPTALGAGWLVAWAVSECCNFCEVLHIALFLLYDYKGVKERSHNEEERISTQHTLRGTI